jgi:hypothetical protein
MSASIDKYVLAYHPIESAIYAYQGQSTVGGNAPINTLIKVTQGGAMTLVPLSASLHLYSDNMDGTSFTFDAVTGVFYYVSTKCQIVMQLLMSDTSTATVMAGSGLCCPNAPCADGAAAVATFGIPQGGMTADSARGFLYFMDRPVAVSQQHTLRRIVIATGQVTTIPIFSDPSLRLYEPWLVQVNGNVIFQTRSKFIFGSASGFVSGSVYAINYANLTLGTTSLLVIAGDPTNLNVSSAVDGTGRQARFDYSVPTGVVDGLGNLYVGQSPTRQIDLSAVNFDCIGCPAAGVVTTLSNSGTSIFFPATMKLAVSIPPFSSRFLMFAAVSPATFGDGKNATVLVQYAATAAASPTSCAAGQYGPSAGCKLCPIGYLCPGGSVGFSHVFTKSGWKVSPH